MLVGFNTGCSPGYPYKRLPVEDQVALIRALLADARGDRLKVVLLGGREDAARNREIAAAVADPRLIESPVNQGLRRGAVWIAACDVVVTGDTLGLHLALALERYTLAWFGLTCHQEIDPRGRGIQVLSSVSCRPCWRRSCELEPKCNARVSHRLMTEALLELVDAVSRGQAWRGAPLRWEVPIGGWWEAEGEPGLGMP